MQGLEVKMKALVCSVYIPSGWSVGKFPFDHIKLFTIMCFFMHSCLHLLFSWAAKQDQLLKKGTVALIKARFFSLLFYYFLIFIFYFD